MKLESVATDIASSKNGILYDAIANYPSVKAFRATEAEVQTIAHEQEKAIAANKRASFSGIIFWASMSLFVRHFIWIAILLVNTWLFSTGKLSVGQFATLLSAILVFANTIWNAIWSIS
jgi:ABC-type multidrug transport system fused ATPase/permease subunit